MNLSKLQKLILEVVNEELDGLEESPEVRAAFADDLDSIEGSDYSQFRSFEKKWGKDISDIFSRVSEGRAVKKLFHKYADHKWLSNLITVHWFNSHNGLFNLLTKMSSKDELSCTAYLPGQFQQSSWGGVGLVVKGRITLLANSMDDVYSGGGEEYKQVMPDRARDSGANKGIGKIFTPERHRDQPIFVFDSQDWLAGTDNEALVDNWKPVAVIYADSSDEELDKFREKEARKELERTKFSNIPIIPSSKLEEKL